MPLRSPQAVTPLTRTIEALKSFKKRRAQQILKSGIKNGMLRGRNGLPSSGANAKAPLTPPPPASKS